MRLLPTGSRDRLSFFLFNGLQEIKPALLEGSVVVGHGLWREGSVDEFAIAPVNEMKIP